MVGHVRKNLFNYEKRKHEARATSGSEKQVKMKQVATRLRLGFLIFTFAVLGTLALPMMFDDMLPQQMEQEFGAGGTTNHDMGRCTFTAYLLCLCKSRYRTIDVY